MVLRSTMEYRYSIWYTYRCANSFCGKNKRYLEELDLKELVLPLIVLDYSKEVAENTDFIVTRQHLEEWESQHGKIEAGTFVASYRLV